MRFFGNIEAKTDAKGRVFLPSQFRKQLQAAGEEQLVLRTDVSGKCLVLYPESAWIRRIDILSEQVSEWDEEEQMVLRAYMAEAESCELDGNGRFLISKRLLQAAGINQAVRFIGMNDTIEIWALEKTEKPFVPQADFSARLKALMSKPRQ
ncbi:MAG: division/cell wall cluster transcriptional repressor MraZ [Prevotella sp.]|nr:division/cell wall cluster transcriptional repressor MraZ [Prevotella sp.]